MELNKYPIVGILKDGTKITDITHDLFNKHSVSIAMCKSDLTKDNVDIKTTIIVDEQKSNIYTVSPNGKKYSYPL